MATAVVRDDIPVNCKLSGFWFGNGFKVQTEGRLDKFLFYLKIKVTKLYETENAAGRSPHILQ